LSVEKRYYFAPTQIFDIPKSLSKERPWRYIYGKPEGRTKILAAFKVPKSGIWMTTPRCNINLDKTWHRLQLFIYIFGGMFTLVLGTWNFHVIDFVNPLSVSSYFIS